MGLFGRDDHARTSEKSGAGQESRLNPQRTPQLDRDRTVITDNILVEGTLSGTGQITVDGRVLGSIDGKSEVVVASRGRVEATVHGRVVTVAGRVVGNITADERIVLDPSAQVDGDITAPRILIRDGAVFRGKVNMRSPEQVGADPSKKPQRTTGKSGQV